MVINGFTWLYGMFAIALRGFSQSRLRCRIVTGTADNHKVMLFTTANMSHLRFIHAYIHSFVRLPRVYKNNNNSEQAVEQDSKATRDALITALPVLRIGFNIVWSVLCERSEHKHSRQC